MSVLCLVSLSKIIFEMVKKIRVGELTWVKYLQLFLLKLTRLNWSREVTGTHKITGYCSIRIYVRCC